MTLWHRAPREVYRVYGEEEYLAEDDQSTVQRSPERAAKAYEEDGRLAISSAKSHGPRSGRLVGLGLLVGVAVGAVGLVVMNVSQRSAVVPRLGVSQSAPAQVSSAPHGARPATSKGAFGAELAIKRSARVRSGAQASTLRSMRRLMSRRATKATTQSRTSMAPALPRVRQAAVSESALAVPSTDGEFDFER